ncbi:MAG TPA: DUF3667 domain-containing protein [Flavobacterium sp.]|uniref:DUF3667 domain-containing protein n=2 Tax=Flavobacterium TaxID=237 RepID=UPI0025C7000B|nr:MULTISPECIES: DUF3667 domain-containing protein [unclassified Flavobacterium]HRE76705.1 DUF3667 domain-containing protein [Flavobacterium sp.]
MSCKNCLKPLLSEDKFCSNCGAQVVTEKLTVKKVVHEFSERYLSFDNKFLTTFKTMFTQPELVVNGYLNGLRVRYVNPITYLIIAVTLSGISIFLMKRGYLGEIDFKAMQGNDKIPFDMKEYMNSIYDYNSVIVFISIPLLALVSKIVFYNYKQFNYAEHNLIYFYTYSQSSISVLLMIPFLLFLKIEFYYYSLLTITFMLVYHCFALKRIFDLTAKQLIKKTLFFLIMLTLLYIIFIIIAAILMIIYMVSTGKFNPQDFAQ